MRRKKILAFESGEVRGGEERVFELVIQHLNKFYDIAIIMGWPSQWIKEWSLRDFPTYIVNKGSYTLQKKGAVDALKYTLRFFYSIWKYTDIARKEKPNLLYVNSLQMMPWVVALSHIIKLPVIVHIHLGVVDKKTVGLIKWSLRSKNVKKIICVSANICKFYSIEDDERSSTVYNGVDVTRFSPASNKVEYQHRVGVVGKVVIGNVGVLIPPKGQLFLIESLKDINDDFSLIFVGGQHPSYGSYYRKLLASAANSAVSDKIKFLGFRDDIHDVMKAFDLLVVASTEEFEACPMAVLEAMATGIPVIAPRLGGIPEIIEDGKNGFLYNPRDKKDLREKISILINNESLRLEMGRRAREDAVNKFSLERQLKRIEEIFEEVLQ